MNVHTLHNRSPRVNKFPSLNITPPLFGHSLSIPFPTNHVSHTSKISVFALKRGSKVSLSGWSQFAVVLLINDAFSGIVGVIW